jgi:tetratricopeptide (TPR) repeat protein
VFEGSTTSPVTFIVSPDVYSWQVELAGYLTDKSGQKNSVDLMTNALDTISLSLTVAGDRQARLQNADAAYNEGQCAQAIPLYKSIEQPAEMRGEVGRTWLASRMQLALCQRRIRSYPPAIETYKQVLAAEPSQWLARYEIGGTFCDDHKFKEGIAALAQIDGGQYLNLVAEDRRGVVQALARYGRAVCQSKELESQPQPDNHPELRNPLLKVLGEFIYAANDLLKGSVPADLRGMLETALKDANAKRADLQGT